METVRKAQRGAASRLDSVEDGKEEMLKKAPEAALPSLTEANLNKHNDLLLS